MLPRLRLPVREGNDGDVWSILASRNASVQGWDIEITGIADVMAPGQVKLASSASGPY